MRKNRPLTLRLLDKMPAHRLYLALLIAEGRANLTGSPDDATMVQEIRTRFLGRTRCVRGLHGGQIKTHDTNRVADAFSAGYEQGHDDTVESRYAPEDALADFMKTERSCNVND